MANAILAALGQILDAAVGTAKLTDPITALSRGIMAASGASVASGSEIGEIEKLDAAYAAAFKAKVDHGDDQALPIFLKEQEAHRKEIAAGGTVTGRGHTIEETLTHLQIIRGACDAELSRITAEALNAARPIADRFIAIAADAAKAQEKIERDAHGQFGVAYTPSALVTQLQRIGPLVRGRIPANQGGHVRPKTMVPMLDI